MSVLTRNVAIASALLLAACSPVATIDDIVTESQATVDDRLVGHWREAEGSDRAHILRGANRDYHVTYIDDDTTQLRVRLGKLGSTQVIDVYPDMAQWKQRDESGLPTHMAFAIEIYGDSLRLRDIRGDSVLALATRGGLRVPYSKFDDGVVLHGDPSTVRATLTRLFTDKRVMGGDSWFRRER